MSQEKNNQQFLLGLFGGIALASVFGLIILGVAFFNIKDNQGEVAGQTENQNDLSATDSAGGPSAVLAQVAGVQTFFEKKNAQICREDGKPVVYLFSTEWCPHCQWIKNTFDETVQKYINEGKVKAYHWELADANRQPLNDNILTAEKESQVPADALAVYQEFNPQGSIPTFVFGCKYYRVGNGYEAQNDLAAEKAEFEALIKDLIK